jgi:hypothetical protein
VCLWGAFSDEKSGLSIVSKSQQYLVVVSTYISFNSRVQHPVARVSIGFINVTINVSGFFNIVINT